VVPARSVAFDVLGLRLTCDNLVVIGDGDLGPRIIELATCVAAVLEMAEGVSRPPRTRGAGPDEHPGAIVFRLDLRAERVARRPTTFYWYVWK